MLLLIFASIRNFPALSVAWKIQIYSNVQAQMIELLENWEIEVNSKGLSMKFPFSRLQSCKIE